jgi:hypothetical protein
VENVMPKKTKSELPAITVAPGSPDPSFAPAARSTREPNRRTPRNHRELAEAIFEECDAVAIGRELLGPNNERASNGVKARIWETLVDFLFGKLATPGNTAAEPKVRIIWDLPSPPHEKDKP